MGYSSNEASSRVWDKTAIGWAQSGISGTGTGRRRLASNRPYSASPPSSGCCTVSTIVSLLQTLPERKSSVWCSEARNPSFSIVLWPLVEVKFRSWKVMTTFKSQYNSWIFSKTEYPSKVLSNGPTMQLKRLGRLILTVNRQSKFIVCQLYTTLALDSPKISGLCSLRLSSTRHKIHMRSSSYVCMGIAKQPHHIIRMYVQLRYL